jgi:hypothetical protein
MVATRALSLPSAPLFRPCIVTNRVGCRRYGSWRHTRIFSG